MPVLNTQSGFQSSGRHGKAPLCVANLHFLRELCSKPEDFGQWGGVPSFPTSSTFLRHRFFLSIRCILAQMFWTDNFLGRRCMREVPEVAKIACSGCRGGPKVFWGFPSHMYPLSGQDPQQKAFRMREGGVGNEWFVWGCCGMGTASV